MVCRVIFEDGYEEAVEVSEPLIFLGLTLGVTPGQADRIESTPRKYVGFRHAR